MPKTIQVWMGTRDDEAVRKLEEEAKRRNQSVSSLVRDLIHVWLAARGDINETRA